MSSTNGFRGWFKTALAGLVRPLEGWMWVAAATVSLCMLGGLSVYHFWSQHSQHILAQPEYRLAPERLQVTAQPEWIQSDVKQSAVTAGRLQEASLLDTELVLQVKQAFGVQPWVKRVLRVNKRFPSTVEVDLEYRRPVAMVEVPAGMFPAYNYEGLLPVDVDGYLLPVEISEEQAQQYPKIGGIDSSPAGGSPGSPWGDPRVAEAAQIVQLLESVWHPLELYRIEVPTRPSSTDGPVRNDFELVTRGRRSFTWGSAPGKERAGEDRASEKAKGLKVFAEKHGSLDAWDDPQATRVSELIDRRRLKN
jgi:hypothetical protein